MFKEGSLIRSNRTGSFVFVVDWPVACKVLGSRPGRMMVARHGEWSLIGNNYKVKQK